MSRWVEELDDELFDELQEAEPLFFVDFYADWCGPCKAVAPVVERAAKAYTGRVTFGKLNIDEFPDIAARYGVRSIPTMVLFREGKQTTRIQGYASDAQLRVHLDRYAPQPEAEAEAPEVPGRGLLSRLLGRR